MPYIKQEDRIDFDELLLGLPEFKSPGELNYFLTKTVLAYEEQKGTSYQSYNDIVGGLECIKQEIYRRVIADFEDYKKNFNGEVYED